MAAGRVPHLTKQAGEYLVASELARRGHIVTTFTGNIPEFDILAVNEEGKSIPVQVKTIQGGSWQFDATKFVKIEFEGKVQKIVGKTNLRYPDLICVFVKLTKQGLDEFYIFRLRELQDLIFKNHGQYLRQVNGVRPENPNSTHTAVSPQDLYRFKDKWKIITT